VSVRDRARGPVATVSIRYQDPDTRRIVERWQEIMAFEIDRPFELASPKFRFIASVAEFAELLRASEWADDGTLEAVRQVASQAIDDMEATATEREFVSLVRTAITLRR